MRFAFAGIFCAASLLAQTSELEKGRALYRSNCAFCHGLTGLGGRGPDLVTGNRKPDAEVKRIIKHGVPGSTMPSFDGFEETELESMTKFITYLAGSATTNQKVAGDAAKGRAVYQKNGCVNCHQIGGEGSTYGPELTRIGGARSLHYLTESLLEPSADIPEQYQGLSVVARDGKKVSGIRVNEDTFTVQLRLMSQRFQSFVKDEVKEVVSEKKSLMPAYKSLAPSELENLVAYLTTLKGQTAKGATLKGGGN
ncbi:MAG: c-type cytochrome [Bryobacteraceae bacterium]